MQRARRYDHGPCTYGNGVGFTRLRVVCARFDAHRSPVFDQHPIGATAHDHAGAVVVGILQIGLHGGLTAPLAAAEVTPAAALLAADGVAMDHPCVVAERRSAVEEHLIGPVVLALIGVDPQAPLDGGEALLQLRAGEAAAQPRLLL